MTEIFPQRSPEEIEFWKGRIAEAKAGAVAVEFNRDGCFDFLGAPDETGKYPWEGERILWATPAVIQEAKDAAARTLEQIRLEKEGV